MTRVACPGDRCKCGFSQNPTFFPTLTNSRAQVALTKINATGAFYDFLKVEGVSLSDRDGKWIFPAGVCMKICDKLRVKMGQLGIKLPENNLFSSKLLLPATGPDSETDPPSGSGGLSLSWDDAGESYTKAWNPNPEQLTLDE